MTLLEQLVSTSRRLAPRTKRTYLGRVREYVEFAGSNPHRWNVRTLEAWRDQLLESGLSQRSVNAYLAAVRFASKRMHERGEGPNFASGAERLYEPATETETKALTLKQCKRLLAHCATDAPPDLRDRALIMVGIHAAFRRTELVSITFNRVVEDRITVVAKGNRMHTVQVASIAMEALHRWMAWLGTQNIHSGRVFRAMRHSIEAGGWSITKKLSPDGFAKILRARGEDAGIHDLHPHVLRHTYTSLALQAGVPAWRIKKVLGHRSDLMLERYAHDLNTTATGAEFPDLEEQL